MAGQGEREDFLEVARFSTLPEGELAVALLRDHGIVAVLPDRQMAGAMPHLHIAIGGIRVTAPAERIVEARALIARARQGDFVPADDADDGDWQIEATPGRVGELEDDEIKGALSSGTLKTVGKVVVISLLLSPLFGCLLLALAD